jgi:HD domain
VAGLVIDASGSETQAIAGLLHGAVEDQVGPSTLAAIREKFGDDVARIVDECSDTDQTPKPPWRERKQAYIAHLDEASDVLRGAPPRPCEVKQMSTRGRRDIGSAVDVVVWADQEHSTIGHPGRLRRRDSLIWPHGERLEAAPPV